MVPFETNTVACARGEVGRPMSRGATHHPKSAKRSTFSHKMGKKWGFVRWLRRPKRAIFFGGPHLPKMDLGYRPGEAGN